MKELAQTARPAQQRCGHSRPQWLAMQKGRKAVLYLIRLYGNEGEQPFYKVGISFCFPARFASLKFAGYKWRTIARYESYDAGKVYDLEQHLHRLFSDLLYRPLLVFSGHTECYKEAASILAKMPVGTFILKNIETDI